MRVIDVRRIFDAEAIASTGSATSSAQKMEMFQGSPIAMEVALTGTGPDIKIEFLVAASKNGTYHSADDQDGNDLSTVISASATDTSLYIQFDPPIGKWYKVKVTGVNSNGADVTVTLDVLRKED